MTRDEKIGYIRGFIDGEGFIRDPELSISFSVEIINTNLDVLKEMGCYFDDLGINNWNIFSRPTTKGLGTKITYRLTIKGGFETAKKFAEILLPLDENKRKRVLGWVVRYRSGKTVSYSVSGQPKKYTKRNSNLVV